MAIEVDIHYHQNGLGDDGVRYYICIREAVDPKECCIDYLPYEHSCDIVDISAEFVVGGA